MRRPLRQVTVEILNGNGVEGSADDATYLLGQRGYQAITGGNAATQDYFQTQIVYDSEESGRRGRGRGVLATLFDTTKVTAREPCRSARDDGARDRRARRSRGASRRRREDSTPEHQPAQVVDRLERRRAARPRRRASRPASRCSSRPCTSRARVSRRCVRSASTGSAARATAPCGSSTTARRSSTTGASRRRTGRTRRCSRARR